MKKFTFKKGCLGTALRPVATVALLCGTLIIGSYLYVDQNEELDKAQSKIVQYESSLKHQKNINISLMNDLSALNMSQMDLKSKNDKLLKDNATLDQKLNAEREKVSSLEQKLEQSELQAQAQAQSAKKVTTTAVTISRGDNSSGYKSWKKVLMDSSAYISSCKGCSGVTSIGIDLRKNPNIKLIAVDPSVIPLGSKVYVEGYGYAIAGDTGGAIDGHKIDILMGSYDQAMAWGRKNVAVYVQP